MTKRLSSRLQRGSLKRDLHRHRNGEHGVARPSSAGHAMVGLGCVEQTLLIPLSRLPPAIPRMVGFALPRLSPWDWAASVGQAVQTCLAARALARRLFPSQG